MAYNSRSCVSCASISFSVNSTGVISRYNALPIVLHGASPDDNYCFGFGSAPTDGYYITTMKISTGSVSLEGLENNEILPAIVAYDQAERNGAYTGQVNMMTVSSFSGPRGAIWGYDLAKVDPAILRGRKLFDILQKFGPGPIPVFSMEPLLGATEALFGTEHDRKFPVVAGGHLPTAIKSRDSIDPSTGKPAPGWVWSFLSLAIAEQRGVNASFFIEDAGFYPDPTLTEAQVEKLLSDKAHQVAYSQTLCGHNQSVSFTEIFITWRKLLVNEGYYGTALASAPYILLAQKAYPSGSSSQSDAQMLVNMSLEEWKMAVRYRLQAD